MQKYIPSHLRDQKPATDTTALKKRIKADEKRFVDVSVEAVREAVTDSEVENADRKSQKVLHRLAARQDTLEAARKGKKP